VAVYLQFMLTVCLVIICLISLNPKAEDLTLLIYSSLIVLFITIGIILTTIRIAIKVDLKKAFQDLRGPNLN